VALTLATVVASAVLVAHAIGTHARNRVWLDEISLWEDVAEKSPTNGRGLMNYGVALMARGYVRQALTQFERAEVHAPDYEILQINLAISKSALGEPGAEDHFRRAFRLSPDYARGRYFYGDWLAEESRGPEAIAELERALAISAGDLDARSLLARLYAARGDDARLAQVARGTLSIVPDDPEASAYAAGGDPSVSGLTTLPEVLDHGWRVLAKGKWVEAAGAFRRATLLAPEGSDGWIGLGRARIGLGFVREAESCFARALELDPTLEDAERGLRQVRDAPRW
jgi:tetratricopeptide (TPR) repeat protein